MTRVEERLSELLDAAVPPSDGVAFDDVVRRVRRRRSARRSVVASAVAVAALVSAVTGVALTRGGDDSRPVMRPAPKPATDLVALTRDVACPRKPAPIPAGRLAAFHAVTAVSCDQDNREIPGQGRWVVEVRRVATGGVAALQAAFEHPDDPPGTWAGCTADLVWFPPLVLVDAAGHTLTPTIPVDSCHKPQQQFSSAYGAVTWQEVSVRKVRQTETPQAEAARCPQQYKNMPFEMSQFGPTTLSPGGPVFLRRPSKVRVCVYRVTGTDFEVGSFVRGFVASPSDTSRLLDALARPGVSGRCPAQRTFAAVQAPVYATVELGGCWRVARSYPSSSVGSADAAAVRAVLAGH